MKRIALVAHEAKRQELLQLVLAHRGTLARHEIHAGGTVASLCESVGLSVVRYRDVAAGVDEQVAAEIVACGVDTLIFLWDALAPMQRDPHALALLRVAMFWNVPTACNCATAEALLASPLLAGEPQRQVRREPVLQPA